MPLDEQPVATTDTVRVSPIAYDTLPVQRRLRRFVQRQGLKAVFFKTFGDTRVVGRATGNIYPDADTQRPQHPGDAPASEMVHFAIHSPRSPYGVPRWIGSLLSVLGSRQMEEVNYLYFTNKSVPPLALLVSGGRLSENSIPRVERFIEENLKGKDNFHKILILEAEGAGGTAENSTKTKIELKPLTDAQQQDALFQLYDERNIDKVGASFRLPRILRGESKDFNRAVADAQLRFTEDQVFQPERSEFDHFMNHRLLPDMGIRMWRFRSQAPITRDPERLTDSIERLVRVGVLTPEEGRALAADVFNREFRAISDDWVKRPITLTLAGVQTGVANIAQPIAKSALSARARELIALRDELREHESQLAANRMAAAREAEMFDAEAGHD
jgi:PBSX family phage portal protein